jgi:hypothetical protein
MGMKFDSVVATATIGSVLGIISDKADELERDQDMDGYWTCIAVISHICRETGYTGLGQGDLRDRVLACLAAASPPRA